MDRIRKLFQTFSRTEKRYLKSYLTAFHTKGENKSLELVSLLEKNPEISQEALSSKLYGSPQSKAFLMLKGRLYDRLLDVLTLSVNLNHQAGRKEDEAGFNTISFFRTFTHALMLRQRGLNEEAEELLLGALKQAEEMKRSDARLLVLSQLRNLSDEHEKVSGAYRSQVEDALKAYGFELAGMGYTDEFRTLTSNKAVDSALFLPYLENAISHLKEFKDTGTYPRTRYYQLNLEVIQNRINGNYEEGKENLYELTELLELHPGISSRDRRGIPFLRLAGLELSTFHMETGYEAAAKAMEIISPRRHNYLSAAIYRTYACLYTDRLEEAAHHIESLKQFPALDNTPLILGYLDLCRVYFKDDMFTANRLFAEVDSLQDDKSGWNVGLRINEIMLMIDLNKFDLAEARIETLRKHLERYDMQEGRPKAILRYLQYLERNAFDFRHPSEEMTAQLTELIHQHAWTPLGYEVLRFDTWARARQQQKRFYPLLIKELG
ncbi:MAG: hypothetical protein AAGI38_02955 [Bacteroidota bacterium]